MCLIFGVVNMEPKIFLNQRSDDLYERLKGYPLPPWPAIADINNPQSFQKLGIQPGSYRYLLTKLALRLTGFQSFYKNLPDALEPVLRKKNMRLPGLYAPVISATIALQDDPLKADPIIRSASLIYAAYLFYSDLHSGKLEPDRYGNSIFEMGLYPNLFNTSIVIANRSAKLFKTETNFRINVLIRRQFYILDLQHNATMLSYTKIVSALRALVIHTDKSVKKNNDLSIGLLTAANNRTQFKAFKHLYKDKKSRETVSLLSQSFLTLCLDMDSHPSSYADAAFYAHNTNHGNRWYHSATQFVVFGNGKCAIIFNFTAYLDGITMARAGYEFYKRALQVSDNNQNVKTTEKKYTFQKLEWKFPKKYLPLIMRDIRRISDNQQATFEITNFGSKDFVRYNFEPIPIFVIALYMTVKEYIERPESILQFASLAKYRCMSLLTIEVMTDEVKNFTDIAEDKNAKNDYKITLLREAIESQKVTIRKFRKEISLDKLFMYYVHSKKGIKRTFVIALSSFLSLLSGRLKLFGSQKREILISHPSSIEEIPILGRPGIRLPYIKYFALHYQILQNKIVVTMMPSLGWQISNAEFVYLLSRKLEILHKIIQQGSTGSLGSESGEKITLPENRER